MQNLNPLMRKLFYKREYSSPIILFKVFFPTRGKNPKSQKVKLDKNGKVLFPGNILIDKTRPKFWGVTSYG